MFTLRVNANLKLPKDLVDTEALLDGAQDYARAITPVRTGRLRAGWYTQPKQLRNDVHYGVYVSEGTRFMPAQHQVGRTVKWIRSNAKNYIRPI